MSDERRWFAAAAVFRTGIGPDENEAENASEYSVSIFLFRALAGTEFEAAAELASRSDDDLPFSSGWEFVEILDIHDVHPPDVIVEGTEVYSFFLSGELLNAVRARLH